MGIPKMFRFLADKYPLILQRLDEDHVFDNFYLDMNGIIHQCTHPSDTELAIEDLDQMFSRIFHYTERLFRIVSPTSLMFLAVDGVAPRAKMNQQRSRRFRSAKEAERTMAAAISKGEDIPCGTPFDSNCITPGTQFMYDLSIRFQKWIHHKMSTDPAFQQGCNIVFSGPEVPGEGEHKIMDYIRAWKASTKYDPSLRHCMYGLDADLMMLGLVAHVPHFTLIREKIRYSRTGRVVPHMRGTDSDADEFQLLEVAMLRDMLFLEFKRDPDEDDPLARRPVETPPPTKLLPHTFNTKPFKPNSRRIVDDFVFMCMLIGNDFIPNLPHLDISDGAINHMFRVYRVLVRRWSGYLTDSHRLHPDRLELFLAEISQTEVQYFYHRAQTDGVSEYRGAGYRRAYYLQKFKFDVDGVDAEFHLQRLRRIYMEGLHWVLQYYHCGVSSWNWFYPDFYAVLASDMIHLRTAKVAFQRGQPFRPLTQLMAVLPPESAQFLPISMQNLMVDPRSPIVDFYPADFKVDLNGKRNDWEAVVLVPFIEEERLLREVNRIDFDREFTPMEKKRNVLGLEQWFYAKDYPTCDTPVRPVRPPKFALPRRTSPFTSRRSSSGSSTPSRSRSASPRRTGRTSSSPSAPRRRYGNETYSPSSPSRTRGKMGDVGAGNVDAGSRKNSRPTIRKQKDVENVKHIDKDSQRINGENHPKNT